MSARAIIPLLLVSMLAGAAGVACAAPAKPPYEIVRSLHALQDQMVLGSTAAKAAMPAFAAQLSAELLDADPSVWREPRNARAAVTYVLSGGSPRVARRVLQSGHCPPEDKKLVEGALAYLEGREAKANALLDNIDPRALEPILGGHIALVQAALAAKDDPKRAIDLLDTARILEPGTLVEEAALRREVFLVDETGDFDKFIAMSDQYIRRFSNSAYADNFRMHFATAVARLNIVGTPAQLAQIDDLLSSLGADERLRLYLSFARSSIIHGKIDATEFAADKAEHLARPDSLEDCRARLYDGAASILTSGYEKGLSQLENVDSARLNPDDLLLKDAALSLARLIREWPAAEKHAPAESQPGDAIPAELEQSMSSADSTIALAQKALADSDDTVKDKQP